MLKKDKFDAIWLLIKSGAEDALIMSTMGVEQTTLGKIRQSGGDYSVFKRLHAEFLGRISPAAKPRAAKDPAASGEIYHNITIQANHYMMEELQKQTKLLTLIGNKLTAIMEELGVMNK